MEIKSSADWDGRDMIGQPEPTLTDEELAAVEEDSSRGLYTGPQTTARLIAALRAERVKECNHCGHNPGSCGRG